MRSTCRTFVTLALGLTLGLAGCGGSQSSNAPSEPKEVEQTQEAPAEEEPATQELGKTELKIAGCDYHYTLKEAGSFEGDKNIPSFQYDGAIGFNSDGKPQLLGVDGKPLLDGAAIRGIEYWANGLYLVALDNDEVNNTALVSLTDGTLVPPEAATFSYGTDKPEDARFVEVIYATDKTDNEDECFVYSTDKMVSISVEEGDIMYKGYGKVYDLEKRAFVDGVEITNGSRNAMKDLGDAFVVRDKDDRYTMYDATGKEVWSSSEYVDLGRHSVTYQSGGKSYIVDTKGQTSFVTDGYLNTLESTDDLYSIQIGDDKKIIDSKGNVVLEDTYERITGEYDGIFAVTVDGKPQIIDATGKVLVDSMEEYTMSSELPGVLTYKNADGNRCICLSDGRLIENVDGLMSDFDFTQDNKHLVIKTGSYDIVANNPTSLDKGLLRGHPEGYSDTYALYDLFSGNELLDASYETINWAGGYVYAFKDGKWTVYEAKLSLV